MLGTKAWTKAAVVTVAVLVAAIPAVKLIPERQEQRQTDQQSAAAPSAPIGSIDYPPGEATVSTDVYVSGWALPPHGVARVEVRISGREPMEARHGLPRPDVASVLKNAQGAATSGFEWRGTLKDISPIRHPLSVVVIDNNGTEHVIGRRSVVPPQAFTQWRDIASSENVSPHQTFHVLMAASGVSMGWALDVKETYKGYSSSTQRIGLAVPILYMRTTMSRANDWIFDPDFDIGRKCGNTVLVEDSLNLLLRASIDHQVPIQIILNGGIWADATCSDPDWDLTDHLEMRDENCQWTQDNKVFPDDYLKNLPGSTASPELARALTFNVYASEVRRYKKRNLQAAARRVATFAREYPDLFVGINLDSDSYVNPFFEEREWFDYNPGTIRQFREWLQGSGPYAGRGEPGVPDLRKWRRKNPLTLSQVNAIAGQHWRSWSDVDPPRRFPGSQRDKLKPGEKPIWDDPWYWQWDTFRKHLVALHYAELAQWTHESGVPKGRIFTSMGFVAPVGQSAPFALRITSHGQNYDSGGVSVEGAIPRHGHLGAILYGPSAENRVRMEHRHGLFATFARMDPGWGVVEMNTADLRDPQTLPTYAQAYRAFRDLLNYEARQVTVMAWNGSNGIYAGQPGYVSYTSWRNTPAEEAMRDYMVTRANLPRGARLWTFGSAQHADDDGWSAEVGRLESRPGKLILHADSREGVVTLLSPPDQVVRKSNIKQLILGASSGMTEVVSASAQLGPSSDWFELTQTSTSVEPDRGRVVVPVRWSDVWIADQVVERIKITIRPRSPSTPVVLTSIALIGS